MTATEVAATTDPDIDFSDVPELDDAFWRNARLVETDRTQSVTLRVKKSVLEIYKAQGKGYQISEQRRAGKLRPRTSKDDD